MTSPWCAATSLDEESRNSDEGSESIPDHARITSPCCAATGRLTFHTRDFEGFVSPDFGVLRDQTCTSQVPEVYRAKVS